MVMELLIKIRDARVRKGGEEGTWGEGGVEELLVERTKGIKRKCKK